MIGSEAISPVINYIYTTIKVAAVLIAASFYGNQACSFTTDYMRRMNQFLVSSPEQILCILDKISNLQILILLNC